MRGIERELKLMIDAAGYRRLASWAQAAGAPLAPVTQRNVYFDTPSGALRAGGMMLRVRSRGGAHEATLKVRRAMDDGAMVAEEITAPLASGALQGAVGTAPWRALVAAVGAEAASALEVQGELVTHRAEVETPHGLRLEVDHSEYAGQEDWEVECEVEDLEAARAALLPWLASLGVAATPSQVTKVGRLFGALRG